MKAVEAVWGGIGELPHRNSEDSTHCWPSDVISAFLHNHGRASLSRWGRRPKAPGTGLLPLVEAQLSPDTSVANVQWKDSPIYDLLLSEVFGPQSSS